MSHKTPEERLEWLEFWVDRFDARLTKLEFKVIEELNDE